MSNTLFANKVIESKATDLLSTKINHRSLMTIDSELQGSEGMTKTINTYTYTGEAEILGVGVGSTEGKRGSVSYVGKDYTVQCVQEAFDYFDEDFMKDCRIWMYRGAWAEWEIDHIEMAVPMSPEELRFKRNTILKHQSQMENAPFLGDDDRLFWQRAEDRNRATAKLYSSLGLASYEAMEAFVEYHPIR